MLKKIREESGKDLNLKEFIRERRVLIRGMMIGEGGKIKSGYRYETKEIKECSPR